MNGDVRVEESGTGDDLVRGYIQEVLEREGWRE